MLCLYYTFKGWKHGIATEENAISFEGRYIGDAYVRWTPERFQELGEVIKQAASEMAKESQ